MNYLQFDPKVYPYHFKKGSDNLYRLFDVRSQSFELLDDAWFKEPSTAVTSDMVSACIAINICIMTRTGDMQYQERLDALGSDLRAFRLEKQLKAIQLKGLA
jgi:hypothetical protein